MKKIIQACLLVLLFLPAKKSSSQNVMLNVLTQNSGIVIKNEVVFFELTINNTSGSKFIPSYKLRPQVSFPNDLVEIPETGHVLPNGWAIVSNLAGVVILTNGSDVIRENENRTILIAVKGKEIGGPATIKGTLSFSNGLAPGSNVGSSLVGDNPADNVSTSTIEILKKSGK